MSNSKRTLAIVAPYFPPYGGGLENYTFEIARRLGQNHAWRVIVITSGDQFGKDEKMEMAGLTVYRLGYSLKISNTPFSFGWFRSVRDILKTERPEVINIHMPVPGIGDVVALYAGKTPLAVTYHAGSMLKNRLIPDILINAYEHMLLPLLLRRADQIICSSDYVRFNFLHRYTSKSLTITPAVDTDLFVPFEGKGHEHPTILFVAGLGRAEQQKGLKNLLKVSSQLMHEIPKLLVRVVSGTGTCVPNTKSTRKTWISKTGWNLPAD